MQTTEPDKELFRLYEAAFVEFTRTGKVTTVHCDKCGGLIEIRSLGSLGSALVMSCPCGRFKDAARGL